MAQPLYFLPHCQLAQLENLAVCRQIFRERGLAETFRDVSQETMPRNEPNGRGPGDLPGCIVTYQRPDGATRIDGGVPRRLDYRPDEQQWTPVGDGSQLWIGLDTGSPPTPEDLARPRQFEGYAVTLGDEQLQKWQIPIIRRLNGSTELPCDMIIDAAGKLAEPIKPAYLRYWEASAEVATWFYGGIEPDKQRGLLLAIEALNLNYRYGVAEHAVIRAIDKTNWLLILSCTVDYLNTMAQAEAQKKSE